MCIFIFQQKVLCSFNVTKTPLSLRQNKTKQTKTKTKQTKTKTNKNKQKTCLYQKKCEKKAMQNVFFFLILLWKNSNAECGLCFYCIFTHVSFFFFSAASRLNFPFLLKIKKKYIYLQVSKYVQNL